MIKEEHSEVSSNLSQLIVSQPLNGNQPLKFVKMQKRESKRQSVCELLVFNCRLPIYDLFLTTLVKNWKNFELNEIGKLCFEIF